MALILIESQNTFFFFLLPLLKVGSSELCCLFLPLFWGKDNLLLGSAESLQRSLKKTKNQLLQKV